MNHHEYVIRSGKKCPQCLRELVKSRTDSVFVWCEDVYCGFGKVKMEKEGCLPVDGDTFSSMCDNNERVTFVRSFQQVAAQVHETAVEKGWWDESYAKERTFASFIANCQAELSEAWEYYRGSTHETRPKSDHIPAFYGIEEELADVIIRIMDTAHKWDIRVAEALVAKMAYNKNRPHRHGGKRA